MPDAREPTSSSERSKPRRNSAIAALRIVAAVITGAAIVGGAGWLLSRRGKQRDHSPPSGP
jgi:hypothetical protein